jgi:hypothetical protein
MKENVIVFIIISLFLGVAINPVINSTIIMSSSEEKKTITVELCGIENLGIKKDINKKYKVNLTQKEALILKDIINNTKNKLSRCINRNEELDILDNAIQSLSDIGIFKDEISVEDVKNLVTRKNKLVFKNELSAFLEDIIDFTDGKNVLPEGISLENAKKISSKFINSIFDNTTNFSSIEGNKNKNLFCIVAGETEETFSAGVTYYGHLAILFLTILTIAPLIAISSILQFKLLAQLLSAFLGVLMLSPIATAHFSNLNTIPIGHTIGIGRTFTYDGIHTDHHPANGWINTFGLYGNKSYDGKMYGKIPLFLIINGLDYYHPGITGFNGIKIINEWSKKNNEQFYFGTALVTNIGNKPYQTLQNKPEIVGPNNCVIGEKYSYNLSNSNPKNENLYYIIDWGNEETTYGPFSSNKVIAVNHTWNEKGSYDVKTISISDNYEISEWSDPISVEIKKDKSVNRPRMIDNIIQRLLAYFPMIKNQYF